MLKNAFFAGLVFCLLGSSGALRAQSAGDWTFQATPYAWMSGLQGQLGTIPGAPPVDVDLTFSEILENLDFGVMLAASARNGPWVIFLDTTYVRLSTNESLGGVVFDSASIKSKTTTLSLALGRTVAQSSQGSLDAYVGARAWELDNTFALRSVGGAVTNRREKASWVDPLVGLAGRYRPSERWTLFGALEAGGFGVGADSEWSLIAGATYNFSDRFGLSFGWRHLEVDYSDTGVLFDVRQSGPLFGATFRF